MSTPYLLQMALRDALLAKLESFPLTTREKNEEKEIISSVYIGDLPARSKDNKEFVPFICIQENSGKDKDGMTEVEIIIRLAVYSQDIQDATLELSNFLQFTRHILMEFVNKPLENRYRLIADERGNLLTWERPLEQRHPYSEAFILSTWSFKGFEHY